MDRMAVFQRVRKCTPGMKPQNLLLPGDCFLITFTLAGFILEVTEEEEEGVTIVPTPA